MFDASVQEVLGFLSKMSESVNTYGTLNTYRSAISLISNHELGDNPAIKRFFKGFSVMKPPSAKYQDTWDPDIVLRYLVELGPNTELKLKDLSMKLVTLIALATAQRLQTICKIKLENIKTYEKEIKIYIPDRIKTSKLGKTQPVLLFPFLNDQPELCVATLLQIYMEKTKDIRPKEANSLILTYKKPYHPAGTQTISRWVKDIMEKSGIDTLSYSGYSVKHASVSSAKRKGVNVEVIRQTAGWSEKSNTFGKFYNRPLRDTENNFLSSVLNISK